MARHLVCMVIILIVKTISFSSQALDFQQRTVCALGEHFSSCSNNECQPTCKHPESLEYCVGSCQPGCICNENLVRREMDNKCVALKECLGNVSATSLRRTRRQSMPGRPLLWRQNGGGRGPDWNPPPFFPDSRLQNGGGRRPDYNPPPFYPYSRLQNDGGRRPDWNPPPFFPNSRLQNGEGRRPDYNPPPFFPNSHLQSEEGGWQDRIPPPSFPDSHITYCPPGYIHCYNGRMCCPVRGPPIPPERVPGEPDITYCPPGYIHCHNGRMCCPVPGPPIPPLPYPSGRPRPGSPNSMERRAPPGCPIPVCDDPNCAIGVRAGKRCPECICNY